MPLAEVDRVTYGPSAADPRVVTEDMYGLKPLKCPVAETFNCASVGDVRWHAKRLCSIRLQRSDRLLEPRFVDVAEYKAHSLLGECGRQREPEALGGSRNDCHFACEDFHFVSLSDAQRT